MFRTLSIKEVTRFKTTAAKIESTKSLTMCETSNQILRSPSQTFHFRKY